MREVAEIIRSEMKDPRIGGLVSITRVEMSKDLKFAKVFISVYGGDSEKTGTMRALEHGAGFIRSLIGKRMRIRTAPELVFRLDDSIEHGARIHAVLKELEPEMKHDDEPGDEPEMEHKKND